MLTEQLSSAGVKRFFSMAVWRCREWNLLQPPILHGPQESLCWQGCPMCEIARQRIQPFVDLEEFIKLADFHAVIKLADFRAVIHTAGIFRSFHSIFTIQLLQVGLTAHLGFNHLRTVGVGQITSSIDGLQIVNSSFKEMIKAMNLTSSFCFSLVVSSSSLMTTSTRSILLPYLSINRVHILS